MLEDFLSYIECNLSVISGDKILLSVSGGIDSMVMLHLFQQLNFEIVVSHINHSTRNGGSDADMIFVETYCMNHNIPFRTKTLDYKKISEGNFQENARIERFDFLQQVQNDEHCKWIATAHHKEDRWETFLMHLNRKSGIQGLTSLRPKENSLIHPLLIFTKEQIIAYGQEHKIKYVHDISNDSNAYKRNSIRNIITPKIVDLFPDFVENANQSIVHLTDTSSLLNELIDQSEMITQNIKTGYTIISLDKIKAFQNQQSLLYQIIEKFGFNSSIASDILKTHTTGAQYDTTNHEGLYDRGNFIIRKKKEFVQTNFTIDSPGNYSIVNDKKLDVNIGKPEDEGSHLWLDSTKVEWPLTVRNIQPGDKIKPHGMNGATKTIKKLCTDHRINRFDKQNLLVVCQGDTILQVIGIRTCHEYVTPDIKYALTFNIID